MLGTVSYIDKKSGLFIIRNVDGQFILALAFESNDISLGDIFTGVIQKQSYSTLKNEISGKVISILILESRQSEKDILLKLRIAKRNYSI